MRDTRAAYRRRAANVERAVDAAVTAVRSEADLKWAAAKERAKFDAANEGKYAASDLISARAVRTKLGWRSVVKVNTKTVTVSTEHPWTTRVDVSKVREWR